jgi:hypothetical protein
MAIPFPIRANKVVRVSQSVSPYWKTLAKRFFGVLLFVSQFAKICNEYLQARCPQRYSDEDSGASERDDGTYNLNWVPEGGSVFNVPFTEFYNKASDITEAMRREGNWQCRRRRGQFVGSKRSNSAKVGMTYGIHFEGDPRPSYYPDIYEWEFYCSGPSLSDADDPADDSDRSDVVTKGVSATQNGSDSGNDSEDGDRVIAEYDEDDLDEDLFEEDDADAPPILDDDTPMDKVLERLSWKDEGVIDTQPLNCKENAELNVEARRHRRRLNAEILRLNAA